MTFTRLHELTPAEGNPRNSEGCFLTLRDGRIAFAYSRYRGDSSHDHAFCEIAVIFSSDGGESWSQPRILVSPDSALGETNCMSVTLRRMDNGDVGLFYLVKYTPLTSKMLLRRSADELETLSLPVACVGHDYPNYYVVNNDRVLRTQSGRWLIPAALHPSAMDGTGAADLCGLSAFYASDDDGVTWRRLSPFLSLPVGMVSDAGLREPGITELAGGTLYAWFRTDLGRQYESVSVDSGESWFPPKPSRFTSPDSPLLIQKNPHGGYVALWNPAPNYPTRSFHPCAWGRTPLALAQSPDGVRFSPPMILEDDPAGGFCYPAIHFTGPRTLLVAYCAGSERLGDTACLQRTVIGRVEL